VDNSDIVQPYRSTVSKTRNKLMPSAKKKRNLSATLTGNNARNYFDNHKGECRNV
jgi:hypothetical protein